MRALVVALVLGIATAAHARAPTSFTPESTYILRPNLISLSTYGIATPVLPSGAVTPEQFGAVGNGTTDDTAALQACFDAPGACRLTADKVYRKTALVTVTVANKVIWGYGSTVYADTNGAGSPDLAIKLAGSGELLYGITIVSNLAARVSNTSSAGVWITGTGAQIIDARIEYTGTCAFVQSTYFVIARSVCYRDWADGWTIAGGVSCACAIDHGLVVGNIVRQNGDDMISVVNYADVDGQEPFIADILIEGNDLADSYGGAGVAVHGGKNITIRNNRIGPVPCVVGIQVDSQVSFLLRNVRNVLATGNRISDVQVSAPVYLPTGSCSLVDHGAIYVNASGGGSSGHTIDSIRFENNTITRARRRGIQAQQQGTPVGIVSNAGFTLTRMIGILATPISLPASVGMACTDNQLVDDRDVTDSDCSSVLPTVTGSGYVHL